MSRSRRIHVEPADIARAAVPLLLLLVAVVAPWLAGPAALLLAAGVAVAAGRRAPVAWAWAAALPAAVVTAVRAFGPARDAWSLVACGLDGSPPLGWAVGEAVACMAVIAVLALLLAAKPADLGLRTAPRYATPWILIGFVVILVGGLAGVVLLGPSLFGLRRVELGGAAFLAPAAIVGVALAVSEELAWRGALQGWLARSLGPWPASLVQGGLYGVAWGAATGSPLGGVVAGAAGLVLGATVARTRSIAVALAWHIAAGIPWAIALACGAG